MSLACRAHLLHHRAFQTGPIPSKFTLDPESPRSLTVGSAPSTPAERHHTSGSRSCAEPPIIAHRPPPAAPQTRSTEQGRTGDILHRSVALFLCRELACASYGDSPARASQSHPEPARAIQSQTRAGQEREESFEVLREVYPARVVRCGGAVERCIPQIQTPSVLLSSLAIEVP
ncbi:hypothetical protein G7Z17_g7371 [Cylindrodendrum hubeiense]|uniref:Uncharacterized protein n=1 Tax=Cylindrodendrum hubeiense TaxID=595255 RepID=A0A9P5L7F6_9HYPO|nr:hypothetical protein G7Z17_g7371 [Cylindrodendrum hubeiense]